MPCRSKVNWLASLERGRGKYCLCPRGGWYSNTIREYKGTSRVYPIGSTNLTSQASHQKRRKGESSIRYAAIRFKTPHPASLTITRYTTLHKRLTSLVSSLNQQQRQLAQYKRLRELLVPYQAPRENIQPNLVMRGGELVGEVEKMRLLVARVSGRLADRNGR